MFYCRTCQRKNGWPQSFTHSYGRCEVCKKPADCYDIPSSQLGAIPDDGGLVSLTKTEADEKYERLVKQIAETKNALKSMADHCREENKARRDEFKQGLRTAYDHAARLLDELGGK